MNICSSSADKEQYDIGGVMMTGVLDFIGAAAPWVAAGLAVAVLAARGTKRKRKGKKHDDNYGTEGMCLGMCFGSLIGTMFDNNTGIGLSPGMLAGLAIGSLIQKK